MKKKLEFLWKGLWTGSFTFWWIVSLITVLIFDIFWMLQTTFSSMSYFAFWMTLILSSFFLSLPSLFTKNAFFQLIWLLFFDALFIANLMYCYTYYDAIPLHSYTLIGNLRDFSASVTDAFKWRFILLPMVAIGAFFIYMFHKNINRRLPNPIIFFLYVAVFGLALWISDFPRGGSIKRMKDMTGFASMAGSIPPIYSLAGFLITDYHRSNDKLQPSDIEKVTEWIKYHDNLNKPYWNDTIRRNRKIPKNIVLILCESLESWVLNTEIEGKEITPNLNSLLADSTTFYAPNVVTQVGSGRSIDGQLLVNTGILPMKNQVYAYRAPLNKYFALPDAFKATGGKSILFTCDKAYVWNQVLVAEAFGVDTLVHGADFKIDEKVSGRRKVSDGSLMRQIKEKLENDNLWPEGEKRMITAVTYSGHNPFKISDNLKNIHFDGDYPEIIVDYMTAANYTDASLAILIDYFKSRKDWEETMVIITGDHEGLASDRKEAIENKNSSTFVDPSQHTPLIILNSPIPGKFEGQLGQADIYSTLLDLLNLEYYPWRGLGLSIFDPSHPKIAVGSAGNIEGDTMALDPKIVSHIKEAQLMGDLILKFNLLKNYPDSIP
ncbi:MAG: LTA synthase family protein [Muribaculaceae bacterium]|nr:LTA synthase family protein [Muribaculaceae bacterium]